MSEKTADVIKCDWCGNLQEKSEAEYITFGHFTIGDKMEKLFNEVSQLVIEYNRLTGEPLIHLAYFPETKKWTLIDSEDIEETDSSGTLETVKRWLNAQISDKLDETGLEILLKTYTRKFDLGYYIYIKMYDDGSGSVYDDDDDSLIDFRGESDLKYKLKDCIVKNDAKLHQ